jgi:hypothetical protein
MHKLRGVEGNDETEKESNSEKCRFQESYKEKYLKININKVGSYSTKNIFVCVTSNRICQQTEQVLNKQLLGQEFSSNDVTNIVISR